MDRLRIVLGVWVVVLGAGWMLGCGGGESTGDKEQAATHEGAGETAQSAASDQEPDRVAARHILIAFQGSANAPEAISRTKEEALARAQEVVRLARKDGADFGALAAEYSDGPTKDAGGYLGAFGRGRMVKAFEDAAFALGVGDVSDVVETQFGYHVISRVKIEEVGASHILVAFEGAERSTQERSQAEARTRAEEVLKKARAGVDFAELAKEYSDGPSGPRGGSLGVFGRHRMVPAFDEAAFALDVGEISEIVETPFGYHIIKRDS